MKFIKKSFSTNKIAINNSTVKKFETKKTSLKKKITFKGARKENRKFKNARLFLEKSTKENFIKNGGFYEAIAPAQCFALMPVNGILGYNVINLSFSWLNYRTIYCIGFIFITFLDTVITFYWFLDQKFDFNNIEPLIFHVTILIVSIHLIKLGQKWQILMIKWDEVEKQLPKYTNQKDKGALSKKIKIIAFVAMMLSLTEHLLNIISIIYSTNYCPSSSDPFKNFFTAQLSQLFHVFNYNPYLAIIGKAHNIYLTFCWNFMDLFLMVISIGLSSLFKQINDSLKKVKGMETPNSFWAEQRINYRNVCTLCEEVDDIISLITIVSFSNNLYFICIQLLKSLNKMPSFAHGLYFYFSLIFLIGRTLAVSLYSANINDESKYPSKIFRYIPNKSWCIEVIRFAEHVNSDIVALSGMRFFYITRKLILSIAGTIITYELVLIQFHDEKIVLGCGA